MPHLSEQKTKKRKHAVAENLAAGEPSSKRSKTEKMKEKGKSKENEKQKDRGKGRADGQFNVVQASLALSIPPVFANNLRVGAEEMLDSMVMRYIPALQGVVLAHDNLRFLTSTATVKADCPFTNCRVSFDATTWSPHIGMKLDQWEFEYGPAENDPEFGMDADVEVEGAEEDTTATQETEDSGRWVHKLTGAKLGGADGHLELTVVGLTIANQMLSLIGSIQLDPFSPEHVPDHTIAVASTRQRPAESAPNVDDVEILEEASDSDDEDTFEALGRLGDEAAAKEAKRKTNEAEAEKKERKRKRKEKVSANEEGEEGASQEKKKKKKKA
ncbi:hypothetical protein EW026_g1827 [Hermanssonia centrifuga]|uniref:RPA43 OB domain-containing protein n=1 Tax=Hermanssonia centrifuga TaxID=98765 RepID=A0A4S4KQ72_9APHY|nr:hypothetical protein EW026_g1827 [Hermanssonia centrifuga]